MKCRMATTLLSYLNMSITGRNDFPTSEMTLWKFLFFELCVTEEVFPSGLALGITTLTSYLSTLKTTSKGGGGSANEDALNSQDYNDKQIRLRRGVYPG